VLPTLAEIAGAKLTGDITKQVEGRSLVPLLQDANAAWPERYLFTHVGRWEKGRAAESKYRQCSVRSPRYQLVCTTRDGSKQWELYDLQNDLAETKNIAADHAEIVEQMETAYDQWWDDVLPRLENENAVGPQENPFKELYWRQFGGGPEPTAKKPKAP
jgi:arylsulfatase A-like enzyme